MSSSSQVSETDPAQSILRLSPSTVALCAGGYQIATDDAYPLRDVRIHQLVEHVDFAAHQFDLATRAPVLSRVLRIPGVFVPCGAAAALGSRRDYVRLGLPRSVYTRLRGGSRKRERWLDDPLYESRTADVWWVRAWPTDGLATTFAPDGRLQQTDAAALLRQTGLGFAATVDLRFDFFFAPDLGEYQGPLLPAHVARVNRAWGLGRRPRVAAHGLVVTVTRSVVTSLHDGRLGPVRRAHVDDWAEFGCHLPTHWAVLPDSVLAKLVALGRPWPADAAEGADEEEDDNDDDEYDDDDDEGMLKLPALRALPPLTLPPLAEHGLSLADKPTARAVEDARPDEPREYKRPVENHVRLP